MSSFQASYKGIGELLRSDEMLAEMERRGKKMLELARAIAPVGTPPDDKHPGAYKESLKLELSKRGGARRDRAEVQLIADVPYAFQIEHGTGKTEGHHTLVKSLDAARD